MPRNVVQETCASYAREMPSLVQIRGGKRLKIVLYSLAAVFTQIHQFHNFHGRFGDGRRRHKQKTT